jgi:hypothetical protein
LDVDPVSRTITVWFDKLEDPWPAVLLLPPSTEGKPLLGNLEKADRGVSVQWKDVPGGDYILLTEPVVP